MHPGVTVENSKSQKDELIVQVNFAAVVNSRSLKHHCNAFNVKF